MKVKFEIKNGLYSFGFLSGQSQEVAADRYMKENNRKCITKAYSRLMDLELLYTKDGSFVRNGIMEFKETKEII